MTQTVVPHAVMTNCYRTFRQAERVLSRAGAVALQGPEDGPQVNYLHILRTVDRASDSIIFPAFMKPVSLNTLL